MPYIVIKHSDSINAILHNDKLVQSLIRILEQTNVFKPNTIKIFFEPINFFRIGDDQNSDFIYITVNMFSGRSNKSKQRIINNIISFFNCINFKNDICLSVNIHEIKRKAHRIEYWRNEL